MPQSDLHSMAQYDVTALYWACKTGQTDSALLLLQVGAPVNNLATRSDGEQSSPLFWAAKNGLNKVVKKLLEMGADVCMVDLKDCANDEIGDMVKEKIAERDRQGKSFFILSKSFQHTLYHVAPLCALTEEFQDEGGQTFKEATQKFHLHLPATNELHQQWCFDFIRLKQ